MKAKQKELLTVFVSMFLGALAFQLGYYTIPQYVQSLEAQEIRTEEGNLACWYVDKIIQSESYQNATQRVKDIIQIEKDYCVDMPEFQSEQNKIGGNLLLPQP